MHQWPPLTTAKKNKYLPRDNLRKDMNGFYKMVKKYLSFEIKSFEPIHYQNVELDEQVKKYLSFEIKS